MFGAEGEGASIDSRVSVLTSSMFNMANLFTNGNWDILFAGHTKQNPPLGRSKLSPLLLHPSEPSSL